MEMPARRVTLALMAAVLAVAVVVAVLVGPGLLGPLANAPNPADAATPEIEIPSWSVGDRWTYNVTLTAESGDLEPQAARTLAGVVTKEVTEVAGGTINVSVSARFEGATSMTWDDGLTVQVTEATLTGYTLHASEDLSRLRDVREVRMEADAMTPMGPVHASLAVSVKATYEPAWDAWAFPITETDMWDVRTNASVEVSSVARIETWDGYVEIGKNASFAVPLNYSVASAGLQDVVTPAGTFSAMHTFVTLPSLDLDALEELGMLLSLDGMALPGVGASLDVWFGESVGNVVRAVASAGSSGELEIEVLLVAFHEA